VKLFRKRGARQDRLPIARTRRVVLGELGAAERRRLEDELYDLWSDYFVGLSKERFVATHLFDRTSVYLFYGADGTLAGFANANVYPVEAEGRRCAVMTAGTFARLEYDATKTIVLCGLQETLRVRAERPRWPIAYLGAATSPTSYRGVARWVSRFHPAPDREPPSWVTAWVVEVARQRDLPLSPDDPWLTRFPARPRQVGRLVGSRTVRAGGPYVDYFLKRAPHWESGECLLTLVPIDLRTVASIVTRFVAGQRRNALATPRRPRGAG